MVFGHKRKQKYFFFQLRQKIINQPFERKAHREIPIQEDVTSCKILLFLILFAYYTVKKSVNTSIKFIKLVH